LYCELRLDTSNLSGAITLQSNSAINTVSGVLTLSGVISDGASTFSLTKNGAGELRLSGANTYDGATTINAGLLTAGNSSALGSSSVTVVSGASLGLLSGASISATTREYTYNLRPEQSRGPIESYQIERLRRQSRALITQTGPAMKS